MNTNLDTFSITDLRHKTNIVLRNAKNKGVSYLFRHSKAEAALVDIAYLNALQKAYEDYLDTLEFDQTVTQKRISLKEHIKKTHK